jgi:hypothetical protein
VGVVDALAEGVAEDGAEPLLVMGVIVPPASPTHPERAVPALSRVMAMTQWEYLTAPLLIHNTKQILDNFGADGWELVQVSPGMNPENMVGYFKRPVADGAA